MCAIIIVVLPSVVLEFSSAATATNSSIMDTPVTISGFIIGMLVTDMMELLRYLFLMRSMPKAASVPMNVAIRDDVIARKREFFNDSNAFVSLKSSPYQ